MNTQQHKAYLGDGVYIDVERGMVKLTTENGMETTNEIFLEPEVVLALESWLRKLRDPAIENRRSSLGL